MIKDVQIDSEAFEVLGWQPVFHDELFEELVADQIPQDMVVPLDKHVTLQIAPHPSQTPSGGRRAESALHRSSKYIEESSTIELSLGPKQTDSNYALFNGTRRWIQDVTDMYPRSRTAPGRIVETVKATRYEWRVMMLGGVIGASLTEVMYDATQDMPLAVGSSLALLLPSAVLMLRTAGTMHTPWERDAYRFERDPATLQTYGNIITHEVEKETPLPPSTPST